MRVYIQTLTVNLAGEIDEAMGSDSISILDGRNKLQTHIQNGRDYLKRISRIHRDLVGFRIMKGERFDNSTKIYEEITI